MSGHLDAQHIVWSVELFMVYMQLPAQLSSTIFSGLTLVKSLVVYLLKSFFLSLYFLWPSAITSGHLFAHNDVK